MAPPPPSTTFLFAGLILRLISLVGMVVTIGVLSSSSITVDVDFFDQVKMSFKDIYAYRYVCLIPIRIPFTFT